MAENTTIEALIAQGNIATLPQVDPTKTFVEVGVYQNGTNAKKGNGTSYKSYAMDISQFGGGPPPTVTFGKDNYITVDSVHGNDAAAISNGVYTPNFPFLTVASALANAATGDTIVCNPGLHSVGLMTNPIADFYLYPGATLFNPSNTGIFVVSTLSPNVRDLTVSGAGKLINNGVVTPSVYAYGATFNITCDTISNNSLLWGCIYADAGSTINANVRVVDGSANLQNPVIATGGTVNLTAEEVHFSWVGYYLTLGGIVNANVQRTYAYDCFDFIFNVGPIHGWATQASTLIIDGNLLTMQTVDSTYAEGAALRVSNGSTLIHNGTSSIVRQTSSALSGSPVDAVGGTMTLKSDITNIQATSPGRGALITSGLLTLEAKLTSNLTTDPLIQFDSADGDLILNGAVLIGNSASVFSIVASVAKTIRVYAGVANLPTDANITNLIPPTTLIVDPNII